MRILEGVLAFMSVLTLLSEYAIASEVCPDNPRAGYSVSSSSTKTDFWIIPHNRTGLVDQKKSFPILISRYLSVTRPLFSCFDDQKFPGYDAVRQIYCSTSDGKSFGGNTWPTVIPNKSGGLSEVDIFHRFPGYNRVSCRSGIAESYQLIQFREKLPGAYPSGPPLPYFIISRVTHRIEVTDYGNAPQF